MTPTEEGSSKQSELKSSTEEKENCHKWSYSGSKKILAGARKLVTPTTSSEGFREISTLYGASLIVGTIIGPGIFAAPRGVQEDLGSVAGHICMWVLSGILTTLAALCFAELRLSIPHDACEYAYILEAFGKLPAFVYTWMRILAVEPATTAVFSVVFADYVTYPFFDQCNPPIECRRLLAITAVLTLVIMNAYSVKVAEKAQLLAHAGKFTALAVVIVYGVNNILCGKTSVLNEGFKDTSITPSSFALAAYSGLWTYSGWSNVNLVTTGVRKAPKNLPRLIEGTIPFVMMLYVLTVVSYYTMISREDLGSSVAMAAMWSQRDLPGESWIVIPVGVALTALGSCNGTFLSSARLSSFADDIGGFCPEMLSQIHVRSKAPLVSMILRAFVAGMMVMVTSDLGSLLRFYVFTVWFFHGLAISGLIIMRFTKKDMIRPYKIPLVIPIVVVSCILYLVVGPFFENTKMELYVSLGSLLGCTCLYLPAVKWEWKLPFTDRLTTWTMLILEVGPRSMILKKKKLGSKNNSSNISVRRRNGTAAQIFPGIFHSLNNNPHDAESVYTWSRVGTLERKYLAATKEDIATDDDGWGNVVTSSRYTQPAPRDTQTVSHQQAFCNNLKAKLETVIDQKTSVEGTLREAVYSRKNRPLRGAPGSRMMGIPPPSYDYIVEQTKL